MADVDAADAVRASRLALAARLLTLAGAVAIGLVLQHFLKQHLAALQVVAQTDQVAARARLATELRFGGLGLFGLTAALGVSIVVSSLRGLRLAVFPPPGMWGWGSVRISTGPSARRLAYAGMMLGTVLVAASLAGGVVTGQMATALLRCRAGSIAH